MFWDYVYYVLFFTLPLLTVGFFGISLFRYLSAKRKDKKNPGTFSAEEMRKRKILLVVSSVITGVLVAVVIGFIALLCLAIAFM